MPSVNDNNLQRFMAYGVAIRTHFDLSQYLPPSTPGADLLTVIEGRESFTEQDLPQSMHLRQAHGREMSICTDGEFTVSAKGQSWCFEVKDVARFYWREGSATIQFEYLTDGSEDLLAFWLIHIVVPLWFTLEGTGEFFHACSVEIDGAPIMFTAPSMGGKSTLTEYFLRRGHGLVSDDKVAIVEERGKFLAIPSHPNHRPYRRFEDLGIRVDSFCSKSAQIGAVYNLRRVAPDEAVQITEVVGHRKFAVMRPSYLFDFGALRERRLAFTAAMADSLSIYEVDLPWSLEKLEEVYDGICDHFSQRENC